MSSKPSLETYFVLFIFLNFSTITVIRGASCTARAPKPDKTLIMAARRSCHLLFFKIKVRPGSCRSYPIWRPW